MAGTLVYGATQPSPGETDVERLRRSLEEIAAGPATVRETHCSIVILAGDRAYKLKKPVRFGFVDQSTPAAREAACRREAALNADLAPGLVLGVRAVLPAGSAYTLGPAGARGAVDHVVEMRRYDEERTLASLVASGRGIDPDVARSIGRRLAAFHRGAPRIVPAPDYRSTVRRNLEELVPLARGLVPGRRLLGAMRFADAFLLEWEEVLRARAHLGLAVEGHADVRAEHVLVEDDRIRIVDRLEIDELRAIDVADELAFLLMDLERIGAADIGAAVSEGYAAAGGGVQPHELIAFFAAHRAHVRAKVALLRARQPEPDGGAIEEEARELLSLARRWEWRARGPMVLLVTGPPASGKSTVAAALAGASGLPVVRSDVVRHELWRHPSYDPESRAEVYRALGHRAGEHPAVIVDATFGEPAFHAAFASTLAPTAGPLLVIECIAEPAVRDAWVRERMLRGDDPSDADAVVARLLAERFEPVPRSACADRLALDATAAPEVVLDEVEGWLDARLAGG